MTQAETNFMLTTSMPAVQNCCCLKGSAPYWSNPPFIIFDIRALWCSGLCARVPKCHKLTSIHRHQTPPQYRYVILCHSCTLLPPPFGVTPITAKHDVIHKTGSTWRSTMPLEEDRATDTGDKHTKFCVDRSSGSRDMLPSDRQTDRLITILQHELFAMFRLLTNWLICCAVVLQQQCDSAT